MLLFRASFHFAPNTVEFIQIYLYGCEVVMKIEKIKNRNIVFRFPVTDWDLNIHLIMGDQYNYLIDTGLGSLSIAPIKEYLKDNKKPVIVINTHYHWDHVWGNHVFAGHTIIAHTRCRELIAENWEETINKHQQFIKGKARLCLPNLVFEDGLYFPDDKIRIFYTPGHTIDSISVLDEAEKVLDVGDNIGDNLDEIVPNIDTQMQVYINTVLKYQQIDFDTCVSGHNVVLPKEIFKRVLQELQQQ